MPARHRSRHQADQSRRHSTVHIHAPTEPPSHTPHLLAVLLQTVLEQLALLLLPQMRHSGESDSKHMTWHLSWRPLTAAAGARRRFCRSRGEASLVSWRWLQRAHSTRNSRRRTPPHPTPHLLQVGPQALRAVGCGGRERLRLQLRLERQVLGTRGCSVCGKQGIEATGGVAHRRSAPAQLFPNKSIGSADTPRTGQQQQQHPQQPQQQQHESGSAPEYVSPRHTHSIWRRHVLPGRLKSQAAQSSSAGEGGGGRAGDLVGRGRNCNVCLVDHAATGTVAASPAISQPHSQPAAQPEHSPLHTGDDGAGLQAVGEDDVGVHGRHVQVVDQRHLVAAGPIAGQIPLPQNGHRNWAWKVAGPDNR